MINTLTGTPTATSTPTSTQSPTVTPTPSITSTPTKTPTPWLIWFGGADCAKSPFCDDGGSYSIYSDGTELKQFPLPSWPTLPADIEIPKDKNINYYGRRQVIYWEYSPDGTKALIVEKYHDGLYLVDFTDKQVTILQPSLQEGGGRVIAACWSSSGDYIRYLLDIYVRPVQVYGIFADGSNKQLLYEAIQMGPGGGMTINACSPNGQEVAFGKPFVDGKNSGLYILDLNTGDVHPILLNWVIGEVRRLLKQ
jgi:hypothetical protein